MYSQWFHLCIFLQSTNMSEKENDLKMLSAEKSVKYMVSKKKKKDVH